MKLKEAKAAAAAAAAAMHREVLADVEPPATTDPKIAILNLIQVWAHSEGLDPPRACPH